MTLTFIIEAVGVDKWVTVEDVLCRAVPVVNMKLADRASIPVQVCSEHGIGDVVIRAGRAEGQVTAEFRQDFADGERFKLNDSNVP
jgi:hypothetical protein